MKRVLTYLNPIAQLGKRNYSFVFPLITMVSVSIILEFYANYIVQNPEVVSNYAIFLYIALIIYFAFREGVVGGFVATALTITYYAYIIYSRNYTGEELTASIRTTMVLALLYTALSGTIGWLRQTIDLLIQREADGRRRLKAIVQQIPVGVIVTDNTGVTELSNKQAEDILGTKIPVGVKANGDNLVVILDKGQEVSGSQLLVQQVIRTGKSILEKEYLVKRRDGKEVMVLASATPVVNSDKAVIATALIFSDITEKKELEKRKDDFVNMASHELKTPLTSLKLYLETLAVNLRKSSDARNLSILGSVQTQTERLHTLVNDLLDVSRYQTGKLSFQLEEFRLDELVRDLTSDMQATTEKYNIVLTTNLKIKVKADKFRISQVVMNLITNAIKYSPENTDILVSVKRQNHSAVVCVQDFGIGIPKQKQKRIFDRLYQVTSTHERAFPGFGMGLYIAKEIIKRHKGKIWVDSKKDQGSKFFFSLPLPKK